MAPPHDKNTTAQELVSDYAKLIKGKVILTTGVSPGSLGAAFLEYIAKAQPALLILAGRDWTKTEKTALPITTANPGVKTRFLKVDLSSLQSVRTAATEVNSWSDVPVIDVLVNSAGIMAVEYGLSVDGFERHLASNHLGHFLLTNLIINKILASMTPRIVNITSSGHRFSPFRFKDYNFDGGRTYHPWRGYGQSKTANVLMALSLADKLGKRGLLAFSVHPGGILTNLANHLDLNQAMANLWEVDRVLGNDQGFDHDIDMKDMKNIERGTATYVYAAFDPDLAAHNGAYTVDSHVADPFTDPVRPWATSSVEAEKLWRLSEQLVGQKFSTEIQKRSWS
ncbi:hypothetical protein CPB84DRAFT_1848908 [Gymnopilus junonius]|uniref:Short-chain dehydrogenase n=1 Tax=Gymnopilus junonius TaxID=109634 RepID=A0A9P5NK39_GYMJU|nr:hypothetical protein CPB84DRAFT_1848908 [Gymnopilus junonius]